jgi:hypothetical protein
VISSDCQKMLYFLFYLFLFFLMQVINKLSLFLFLFVHFLNTRRKKIISNERETKQLKKQQYMTLCNTCGKKVIFMVHEVYWHEVCWQSILFFIDAAIIHPTLSLVMINLTIYQKCDLTCIYFYLCKAIEFYSLQIIFYQWVNMLKALMLNYQYTNFELKKL